MQFFFLLYPFILFRKFEMYCTTRTIIGSTVGTLFTILGCVWFARPELKHAANQAFAQNTLIIKNNRSILYPVWVATPNTSKVYFSIRLFNITNPDEILTYQAKPDLKEVGPFIYTLVSTKKNVIINGSNAFYRKRHKF